MSVVFDAAALIALERGEPWVVRLLSDENAAGRVVRTHGGVVGQVWRGGRGRQALLARHLTTIRVLPLDADLGMRAGVLLGRARANDVVDAAVVALAVDGDRILTSDIGDFLPLIEAAGVEVDVSRV